MAAWETLLSGMLFLLPEIIIRTKELATHFELNANFLFSIHVGLFSVKQKDTPDILGAGWS